MFTTGAFLHPKQITHQDLDGKNFHFYLIVSSKVKYFKESYLKCDQIVFTVTDNNNNNVKELILQNPPNCKVISYSFIYTDLSKENIEATIEVSKEGKVEKHEQIKFSATELWYLLSDEINFQIEYIGQSFANDGHRNAIERLSNHSTLQKILADTLASSSKKDIRIFLLGAENIDLSSININNSNASIVTIQDSPKALTPEYVNLLEAFLINYFKPKYNQTYVSGSIPTTKHKSYKKIVDENYDEFIVSAGVSESKHTYIFNTDTQSIRVEQGFTKSHIHVSFDNANVVVDDYFYSFQNTK